MSVDERGDAAWTDPASPPDLFGTELVDHGGGVWSTWPGGGLEQPRPHLWHWCTYTWPQRTDPAPLHVSGSRWMLAGTGAHDMPARDPLTLSPSVYWPDCCGLHGFIRNGKWVAA